MATYSCSGCGVKVGENALTCPHCGEPYPARRNKELVERMMQHLNSPEGKKEGKKTNREIFSALGIGCLVIIILFIIIASLKGCS